MVASPHDAHPYAGDPVFDLHVGGKMETRSTVALTGRDELSMAYTPGVARVCEAIAADPSLTRHYTWVPNTVAIVTDGTADRCRTPTCSPWCWPGCGLGHVHGGPPRATTADAT